MSETAICQAIIEHEFIEVYMQTILSHHDAFAIGVEAFIKGIHPETGEFIPPNALFQYAEEEGLAVELDLLIVSKVIEAFKPIQVRRPDSLLFINISEHMIHLNDPMDLLLSVVEQSGMKTTSIVFDIAAYSNTSVDEILTFIEKYRTHGFYISIDDIGKNFFNLDRILLLNPDIIKINHQHMAKLEKSTYTTRLQKHIGRIAHEMGMIVVETGIETDEELHYAYKQGAQYFQGYYIHKPVKVSSASIEEFLDLDSTFELVKKYREEAVIEEMRPFMNKMVMFLNDIRQDSHHWDINRINKHIDRLFNAHPSIENGWILDQSGIQVSRAMINNEGFSSRNARIFNIYEQGHDYSDSDFFRLLSSGALEVWITKPYRSLLSNSTCVTTSSYIEMEGEDPLILCLVFNYDMFKKAYM